MILTDLNQIISKLENLENIEVKTQQSNLMDYLTIKNILYFLIFIGGFFWLYNADFFNNSILESIKSLSELSKDLYKIYISGFLDALKKLNENSVNLSKEEITFLMEIKNLLMAKGINEFLMEKGINELLMEKGINENKSLNRPVNKNLE